MEMNRHILCCPTCTAMHSATTSRTLSSGPTRGLEPMPLPVPAPAVPAPPPPPPLPLRRSGCGANSDTSTLRLGTGSGGSGVADALVLGESASPVRRLPRRAFFFCDVVCRLLVWPLPLPPLRCAARRFRSSQPAAATSSAAGAMTRSSGCPVAPRPLRPLLLPAGAGAGAGRAVFAAAKASPLCSVPACSGRCCSMGMEGISTDLCWLAARGVQPAVVPAGDVITLQGGRHAGVQQESKDAALHACT